MGHTRGRVCVRGGAVGSEGGGGGAGSSVSTELLTRLCDSRADLNLVGEAGWLRHQRPISLAARKVAAATSAPVAPSSEVRPHNNENRHLILHTADLSM